MTARNDFERRATHPRSAERDDGAMAPRTVRSSELYEFLRSVVLESVSLATGNNTVLSRPEQGRAAEEVREAGAVLRARGAAPVDRRALERYLDLRLSRLITAVDGEPQLGTVTRAEAASSVRRDPALGAQLVKAWRLAAGLLRDVDEVALRHVSRHARGYVRAFQTEADARAYRGWGATGMSWYVKTGEGPRRASFVWGQADGWVERFEVDHRSGEVFVLATRSDVRNPRAAARARRRRSALAPSR
ncbi:hypothetical protein L6R52_14045 [Myxococcota bacterium]|nr:hypothetical protein [Myxococcota bacterium]